MLTNDRNTTRVTLKQMTGRDIVQADTVVVGAGIVGLAVARTLAKQGREVLVLEGRVLCREGVQARQVYRGVLQALLGQTGGCVTWLMSECSETSLNLELE